MNTSILTKCLEELNKENFRKDYVIGMLETLIELSATKSFDPRPPMGDIRNTPARSVTHAEIPTTDAERAAAVAEAAAAGRLPFSGLN